MPRGPRRPQGVAWLPSRAPCATGVSLPLPEHSVPSRSSSAVYRAALSTTCGFSVHTHLRFCGIDAQACAGVGHSHVRQTRSFLRNGCTVSHRSHPISKSHQRLTSGPRLSLFCILVILTGMEWYLIAV